MIPKVIHYCHFGNNPISELTLLCINSWKKHCPDYKIVEWNEDNFDVNCIPYISTLYSEGKYAHVSDYARLKIIYENGGIYLDTDVEIIRPIDDFLDCTAFFAMQRGGEVATGLGFGAEAGAEILKELMARYEKRHYSGGEKILTQTCVDMDKKVFTAHGLTNEDTLQKLSDVKIYPSEYFNPKDFSTGKLHITENTVSIHHYDGSWHDKAEKLIQRTFRDYMNKYDEAEAKIQFGKWYRRHRFMLAVKRYGVIGSFKRIAEIILKKV